MKRLKITLIISSFLMLITSYSFAQENAIHLDGVNDYVDCGTDPSLDITGTAITLEAWVYPTAFTTNVWEGNVINKSGVGDRGYMLRVGNNGQVNFNIGTGSWNEINSPTGTVSLNTWHHIAGTYDGTNMRLYVDGVQVAIGALSQNIGLASYDLYLGQDPQFSGRFFPGKIDEVKIWNSTRSATEIVEDMNNSVCGVPFPNLIAYYRFNQGVANGNNAGLTTVIDEIGTANGVLISSALSGTTSNWVDGKIPPSITNTALSICQGDSVMLGGSYQTMAGTYTDSLQTTTGCDSLVITTLTIAPAYFSSNTLSICQGDSVLLAGAYQDTAGTYTDSLQTIAGCDSVIRTVLTILPTYSSSTTLTICQGDSVLLGGAYQTTAGTYTDHLQTNSGCDSIISTVLTVLPSYSSTTNMDICQGDSVLLYGVYQTTTGTYSDSLQTVNGCDSIISTVLTVNPLPNVSLAGFTPDTLCHDEAAIALPVGTPVGGTYSGTGVSGTTFDPAVSGIGMHYVLYSFTDANNCIGVDSTSIKVVVCLGVTQTSVIENIQVYPNPASSTVVIEMDALEQVDLTLKIINAVGQTVKSIVIPANTQQVQIDITDLEEGLYFMDFSSKEKHSIYELIKN
ncbi:LamG-like jellyroll fold domain-containing protein [Aureispira anguillae]|uniref:T9SS type A sorting domain-containing protein n=1 Tax=Aureispira anguillae TaxID=2864201 RepID=A0A916DTV6_9BACT|nr:LamG-like jellyroll fold domain-containing protein [Aureispira anguillae]BDS12132.1 T9SS type A sorting domain-containing protein [Aureispira anguillae]